MSQEYYGNNGENFAINVTWNRLLDRMTLCLWDKVGIPRPLSKEDALLIARMLNNYITLQKITGKEQCHEYCMWSMYGFKQDGPEALKIAEGIAKFFERCNGLMSEEEWSDKFEKESDYDDM